MQIRTRMVLSLGLALVALVLPRLAAASVWTNAASDGQWLTAANWSGGIPNATDAVADVSQLNISSNTTINTGNSAPGITVGTLLLGDTDFSSAYNITNQYYPLTLAVSSGSAALVMKNGAAGDLISGLGITFNSPLVISNLNGGARSLTLAAPLNGIQPLTIAAGPGVILSAINSTFTNLLSLTSGTLSIAPDASDSVQGGLGPTNNTVSMAAGATMMMVSYGVLSSGRTITVNGTLANPSVIAANGGNNNLYTVNSRITGPGAVNFKLPATWGEGFLITNPSNDYAGATYISGFWEQLCTTFGVNAHLGQGPVYVSGQYGAGNAGVNFLGNSNLVYGATAPYTYQPMNISNTANNVIVSFRGTAPAMGSLSGPGVIGLGGFDGGNSGGGGAQAQPATVQLTVGMDNANATFSGGINDVTGTTGTVIKAGSGNWYLTGGSAYRGGLIITNGYVFANQSALSSVTYTGVYNNSAIMPLTSTNGLVLGQTVTGTGVPNDGVSPTMITAMINATNIVVCRNLGAPVSGAFTFNPCGPTGLGQVTVATNATLGGSGGIWGKVVVNAGGTVSPGADVGVGGTLIVNSNVVFNPGSLLQINVNGSSSYGQLVVNGTLAMNNATIVISNGLTLYNGLTVPILTATNLSMNNVTVTPGYQISQVGTQVMLTAQVPTVINNGYTIPGPHSAYLSGTLLSTGTAQTTWGVIYGTNDPGPTLNGWLAGGRHTIGGAYTTPQTVTNLFEQLQTGQTYYFRYWAQNANGLTVADPSTAFMPFATGGYNIPITFSSYTNRTETLTNFPALVVLSNNMSSGFTFANFLSTNGWDLRFVTNLGTTNYLNYEIESWHTNAGQACYVWVQVPTIQSNGTSVIYAMWGAPYSSNQLACTTNGATWSNSFAGVWHLSEGSGTHADSTAAKNAGTINGTVTQGATGVAAGADQFAGGRVEIANQSYFNYERNNAFTFEAWVKVTNPNNYNFILCKELNSGQYTGPYLDIGTDNHLYLILQGDNSHATSVRGSRNVSDSTWHHVVGSNRGVNGGNASDISVYVDGMLETMVTAADTLGSTTIQNTTPVTIGSRANNGVYLTGTIDEPRISTVARSSNWVWACYQNMASNKTFNTYGSMSVIASKDPPTSGTTVLFH